MSALVALYESTGGQRQVDVDTNWMNNDVTGDSKDPCENSWYGVTCSSDGEVTGLDALTLNSLSGSLPTQLGTARRSGGLVVNSVVDSVCHFGGAHWCRTSCCVIKSVRLSTGQKCFHSQHMPVPPFDGVIPTGSDL